MEDDHDDEDDPFDAFGDDDDDDNDDKDDEGETGDDNDDDDGRPSVARELLEDANRRIQIAVVGTVAGTLAGGPTGSTPSSRNDDNVTLLDGTHDNTSNRNNNNNNNNIHHTVEIISHWPPPLYMGPITLVNSLPVGGSRGYVASEPIPSGTLILVEEPMMVWPIDQLGKQLGLSPIRHMLLERSIDDTKQLFYELEYFHPTKVTVDKVLATDRRRRQKNKKGDNDDIDDDDDIVNDANHEQVFTMMRLLQKEFGIPTDDDDDNHVEENDDKPNRRKQQSETHQQFQQQQQQSPLRQPLEELKQLASSRNIQLSDIDILRLLLVLRYNGLESGVYRHVAMLNHNDEYNCVKFLPSPTTSTSTSTTSSLSSSSSSYSEVRTTRSVAVGEPLTISYLPRIMCHASRRTYLWNQHRFDIGPLKSKQWLTKMELMNHAIPPSSLSPKVDEVEDGDGQLMTLTSRIETATEELESMLRDVEEASVGGTVLGGRTAHAVTAVNACSTPGQPLSLEALETAKALEQSALELYIGSKEELQNPNHILLIPILSLHLDACALVLQDPSLSITTRLGVLSRQLASAYHLRPLQGALLGDDHFDLARTNLDLANIVSELLSRSPKILYQSNLSSSNLMTTFASWSSFENQARKEYNRIKDLYPHDVEQKMAAVLSSSPSKAL